jgi:glycosyltransferase involved in cell wall biosynthesis
MSETENPLVSIVIPTYNHKQYVWQAVDSALAQTYLHCEVIVVDDGSTDGTGEMLNERYGDRIRYIYQENQGLSATRNTGTRVARGEFIHYCDADDQLLPAEVGRCLDVFREHPDATLVYSLCQRVEDDGKTPIPYEWPPLPSGDIFCQLLTSPVGNFVPQCAALMRRQAVLDAGGFNENLRAAEDWDMWLRLAARHKLVFLPEFLARYRVRPDAMHTDPLRMAVARLQVVQTARRYPGRERCMDDAAYDRFEAGRHHQLAMVYWAQGRRADARRAFHDAICMDSSGAALRRVYIWFTYFLPSRSATVAERFAGWIKRLIGKK